MAFRSNGPVMVALPPFRGVTRRIVLTAVVAYFVLAISALLSREAIGLMAGLFTLVGELVPSKMIWQFVTYPFVATGLLSTIFAALTVWFFGSTVEDEFGSRWMMECFLVCTIGGGVLACLLVGIVGLVNPALGVGQTATTLWPFSLALLVIFAQQHPNQELNFNFVLRVKAKYIAILYLLVYLAILLSQHDRFQALVVLTNGLCGWLFLRLAPRRGLRFAAAEQMYGLRNAWTRARRRRAAKKFTTYMRKQGRNVQFDESGRYLDPESPRRDSEERPWVNRSGRP